MKLMLKIKYAPTPIEKFITAAIKFEHCSNQSLQEFTLVHWKKKKKGLQNIILQQHCIRSKDATQKWETTKDQVTSRLARSAAWVLLSQQLPQFPACKILINSYNYPTRTVWLKLPFMEHATCYKGCMTMDSNKMGCP